MISIEENSTNLQFTKSRTERATGNTRM